MSLLPFLFIRHGETDWNAEGRLQGGRDTDLNARGRAQAAEAGRRLAAFLAEAGRPARAMRFVVSPLRRARETAAIVRETLRLDPDDVTLDDRLRELHFGRWEGLTWAEVKRRDPARHKERQRDKWNFVPPEGESYAMVATRLKPWLASVDERTVAVAHGGVARALMVLEAGASPLIVPETPIHQGRVLRFADGGCVWL